ncbi:MAG: rhomboid family GlyGly-CTERM serine protease [Gammaproteobacteria bacterium]|jgi:rhomboid family GlyGly-CTERM serine protease
MSWSNLENQRLWIIGTIILLIMIVGQLIDIELIRYQRNWILTGEYWRLISAHWTHVNWTHLGLNGAGLLLCLAITRPDWTLKRWCFYLTVISFSISGLFTVLNPELGWYVGFSGVLFGIFCLSGIDLFNHDRLIAVLLLSVIFGKVLIEQMSNLEVTSSELISSPVIVDAHFYGLISALIIALVQRVYTFSKIRR